MGKLTVAGLILSVSLLSCSSRAPTFLPGQQAPFTRFALLDGNYRTTENYKGSHLLLFFWATTCSHSHSVLEDASEWLEENGRKFRVKGVSINVDKSSNEKKVLKVLSSSDLPYLEHAFSGNDIYDEAYMAYDVGELPTLVLIDPQGRIVSSGDTMDVLEDSFPG